MLCAFTKLVCKINCNHLFVIADISSTKLTILATDYDNYLITHECSQFPRDKPLISEHHNLVFSRIAIPPPGSNLLEDAYKMLDEILGNKTYFSHRQLWYQLIRKNAPMTKHWIEKRCSRAAGSRKMLYLRRRYIPQGRKNPMVSVVTYICVGYYYGSPLSIHTKLSIKIPCTTSQWRHEACLESKTADFHEFPQ